MSECPFCNETAGIDPEAPCPTCGRRAGDPPPIRADGWDGDGPSGPDLELSRGGSVASHSGGPSAYAGGGLSLGDDDDPFAEDAPEGALELDLPLSYAANAPRPASAIPSGPPSSGARGGFDLTLPPKLESAPRLSAPPSAPSLPASQGGAPPDAPPVSAPELEFGAAPAWTRGPADPAAAMIARYPATPDKVWETPAYALKVLWRQLELRQDLVSLRRRRSPDAPLYERALRTHDAKTFALGLAITCAGLVVASFIFFLPVLLRFLRAPD